MQSSEKKREMSEIFAKTKATKSAVWAWEHFGFERGDDRQPKREEVATCRLCKKTVSQRREHVQLTHALKKPSPAETIDSLYYLCWNTLKSGRLQPLHRVKPLTRRIRNSLRITCKHDVVKQPVYIHTAVLLSTLTPVYSFRHRPAQLSSYIWTVLTPVPIVLHTKQI